MGKLGKRPTKQNEEIGFRSGGSRDKTTTTNLPLKPKNEKFNDLSIVLDSTRADANIQLLDEDGQATIVVQSKGRNKEEINQILKERDLLLEGRSQNGAKTQCSLSLARIGSKRRGW